MPTPTTYLLSRGGKINYLLSGLVLGLVGLLLLSVIFIERAPSQNDGWPVYVFVGLVSALWLGYSAYCLVRGLKSRARVVVDVEGFSYEGLFRTYRFRWAAVTSVRWVYDRASFGWVEVTTNRPGKRPRRVILDFSGLEPNRMAFLRQVRAFAPRVEVDFGLGRSFGAMDSRIAEAFAKARSEMDAVFQETQGKLDDAADARMKARLQAISTTLDKELADCIAEFRAGHTPRMRWVISALVVVFFVLTGSSLESTVGSGFILSGSNEYRAALPWLFGILIPIFAVGWFFLFKRANPGTWFVRWLIAFPVSVAFSAAMVLMSPLGWAALLGRTMGTPVDRVDVSVVSIGAPSSTSGRCHQDALLAFRNSSARICLDGRLSGPPPRAGDEVMVSGRISRLGLYIDRIDRQ